VLQRHYTVAQKGEKESPVQAIETEISQGEPAASVRTGHARSHSALTDVFCHTADE